MRKLFLLIFSVVFYLTNILSQSPHGKKLTIKCDVCHTETSWAIRSEGNTFNHNKTKFPLVGNHKTVSCRKCHISLVFSEAKTDCAACHKDIHQGTVGRECERCHTPRSWIVKNIKQIHQQRGFALIGSHATADCQRCHKSASLLRFDNQNTECVTCHLAQYNATTQPNHRAAGYSTDCNRCHNMVGRSWNSIGHGFEHGFFPLTGGHNIACSKCHTDAGVKQKLNPDCKSCHASQYVSAVSKVPAHNTTFKSYECAACHNTNSWYSISFKQHTTHRTTIYSSPHKGKWSACSDCHIGNVYPNYSCRKCHDFDK